MASIEDKITELEIKLKQAKAQKQKIESRKRAIESKAKRSQDTRRKILVGAIILHKVEQGEWPREQLDTMLNSTLFRNDDRALFGLPPMPDEPV